MKAAVDSTTVRGHSPLYTACDREHVSCARILIDANANVNLQTKKGGTPLVTAITGSYTGVVRLLLDSHADANMRTDMTFDDGLRRMCNALDFA